MAEKLDLKIRRALLSVSDKRGIIDFAYGLTAFNVELISTGGTAQVLGQAKIRVTHIEEVTGYPELMGGRVKTLHPAIHAALLAVREDPQHMRQMEEQNIQPIDLVAVNLYPFAQVIRKKRVRLSEAIENIDIGGPTMIRSAAKNFYGVVVVVNPEHYGAVLKEMETLGGILSLETRKRLAIEAFRHTGAYDETIFHYLREHIFDHD